MKRSLYYILPLFLALGSCKKNALPPETTSQDPVFYTRIYIGGGSEPVTLDAANGNYYMDAQHYQDPNNIYVYKAELKPANCNGPCGPTLGFYINDVKVSDLGAPMDPGAALFHGEHPFNDGNLPPIGYNLACVADASTWTYTWSLGSVVDTVDFGLQTYSNYFTPGTHTIGLQADNGQTSSPMLQKVFNLKNDFQVNILAAKVTNTTLGTCMYTFTPTITSPQPGLQYEWDFGDGSPTIISGTVEHSYPINAGYKTVRLKAASEGQTSYAYYQVTAFPTQIYPNSNFNTTISPVPNTLALQAVEITYTDQAGTVFSSKSIDQPTGTVFRIVSVEDYKANGKGDPTKKVKIEFNCRVKSASGSPLDIQGDAVIAVSFKN